MKRKITSLICFGDVATPYRHQLRMLEAIYETRRAEQNLPPLQTENIPQWYHDKAERLREGILQEAMKYKDSITDHVIYETPAVIDYSYTRADVLRKKWCRKLLELGYRLIKEGYSPHNTQFPENLYIETYVWQQSKKASDSKQESKPRLTMWQRFLRSITKTRK